MKKNRLFGVALALLMAASGLAGCAEDASSGEQASSGSSSESDFTPAETVPTQNGIELFYGAQEVSEELSDLMTRYFKAIQENDYDTYASLLFPVYRTRMEEYLQKEYSYGLETSFAKRRETFEITDTNHFRFTAIRLIPTEETDISGYLTYMETTLGEDFSTAVMDETDESCILSFSLLAVADDMEKEETVAEDKKMAIAKAKDGSYYLFG